MDYLRKDYYCNKCDGRHLVGSTKHRTHYAYKVDSIDAGEYYCKVCRVWHKRGLTWKTHYEHRGNPEIVEEETKDNEKIAEMHSRGRLEAITNKRNREASKEIKWIDKATPNTLTHTQP